MKYFLLILFPFILSSQKNEAAHFYGAVATQQLIYHTVNKNIFNTRFKSLLFSYVVTNVVIQAKEIYDCYKPNKTGYSIKDVLYGNHGCNVATIVQTCANDYNKKTDYIDEQYFENYGVKKDTTYKKITKFNN